MNAVALIDLVALLAFSAAFGAALMIRSQTRGVGASLKYLLLAGFGLYVFVSASNVLEYAGIAPAFDAYEDFAEVLFVPLVAYILYSRSTSEQLIAAENAERRTRREHELLMSVVDTTPAGILVATSAGDVTFANDEARRIMDLREAGADNGSGGLDLAFIVRDAPVTGVLRALVHDGVRTWVSVSATPLPREADDAELRAVVVLEDVTDRVQVEDELEHYRRDLEQLVDRRTAELLRVNRELKQANESSQRFLANMSHELRTPLNAIIGFTDLLLRELPGPVTEEQRRQLEMVKQSSTELLGLVDNVLDLARIEAGHGAVVDTEFALAERVCGIVDSMAALAEVRGVGLSCSGDETLWVRSDADKLGQIVRNLVSNAIKFTDHGGSVDVRVAERGDDIVIEVADTGIGIPPEHHDRVFEAFAQVETGDRVRPQGTGLGLAISRELCALLGCQLEMDSVPEEGSTFTVVVPAAARVRQPS